MYKNWINAVLGLVIIGVAFMDLSAITMVWILGVAGTVITLSNLWDLFIENEVDEAIAGPQV
jgi:hypothetical protein